MKTKILPWLAPLIGTMFYPHLITHFSIAMKDHSGSGSVLTAGWATLLMLLAMAVPLSALWALMSDRNIRHPVLTRSMLHLMSAIPPIFVIILLSGVTASLQAAWFSLWIVIGLLLFFVKEKQPLSPRDSGIPWLRVVHGGSALLVLCGFIVMHLTNHSLALWSIDLHISAIEFLRLWYRSDLIEPVLLALLIIMILTGIPMVVHYASHESDKFRRVQMATGVYIGLFLCAHIMATFGARSYGVETDWIFATGETGLLHSQSILFPYYTFSVFFLILHVACGLRIILLKHHISEPITDQTVYFIAAAGLVFTSAIAMASLGFHFVSA